MATNSPDLEGPVASEATPLAPSSPSGVAAGPPAARPTRWPAVRVFLAVAAMVMVMLVIARGHGAMRHVPLERRDFDASHQDHEKISLTLPASPYLRSSVEGLLGRHRQKSEGAALRWGILGPGRIAHDFAATLSVMGCTITAVAASHDDEASSVARARKFAKLFAIPNYYGSYEELAANPDVEIVYVATTNQNHMHPTLLMLRAGKSVLVEKPTAVTYVEAKRMYEEAKKRGLFLMTNHWTRFFPLVKYLRRIFLDSDSTSARSDVGSAIEPSVEMRHDLGKALAMRGGDFSFVTPLNPSDRYLNRTLGGGVTLDVGCYLVELALLAAYDHRQSHQSTFGGISEALKEYLMPDGIDATGHGVYEGRSFPVDVESSFSLRWGGGAEGIAVDGDGSIHPTADSADEFTMIGSFQASFRRPSSFDVEYVFERGRIVVHGPGNCPSEMTVYEHENRYGPLVRETKVQFPLPPIRKALLRYGRPNYPRPEGFAYVIEAIERCMAERGVPGRTEGGEGCLELEENTTEEQLVTVEVTEEVLKKMGYFGKGHSRTGHSSRS